MNKLLIKISIICCVLICGCARINFTRNNIASPVYEQHNEWHHIGILRLVEFSEPVDMIARCQEFNSSDWTTISTEQNFVQGLIQGVSFGIYAPWNMAYSCR